MKYVVNVIYGALGLGVGGNMGLFQLCGAYE